MKKRLLLFLAITFLLTGVGFAQFSVVSSTPSNEATGVSMTTNISFTFNAAIDTSQHFGFNGWALDVFDISPSSDLTITGITYSTDLKTATFHVTHSASEDFSWIILTARDKSGQYLDRPYVLNYSTSTTSGSDKVSGTLTFNGTHPHNAVVGLTTTPPTYLANPLKMVSSGSATTSSVNIGGAPTILYTANVSSTDGTYTITNVKNGTYYPLAVEDVNGDGVFNLLNGDAAGYLDSNHDGTPDSIVVKNSDTTNVDFELKSFGYAKASAYLGTAETEAAKYASDQQLYYIYSTDPTVGSDGMATIWAYIFYSGSKNLSTVVFGSASGVKSDTTSNYNNLVSKLNSSGFNQVQSNSKFVNPLPNTFVDSDIAMQKADTADNDAGSNFRNYYSGTDDSLVVSMVAGMAGKNYPSDTTKNVWTISYSGYQNLNTAGFTGTHYYVLIDLSTGAILKTGGVATGIENNPVQKPSKVTLDQNYPNPFNPSTNISFGIPQTSLVRLTVYDVLGRKVATLIDSKMSAGSHTVRFDANHLGSGIYFYRLIAGGQSITKKLTLIK